MWVATWAFAVVVYGYERVRTLDLTHRLTDRLVIAAPALLPPLWFEVVRNHTQIHAFPARSVPIALGIVAVAIVARRSEPRLERTARCAVPGAEPEVAIELDDRPRVVLR